MSITGPGGRPVEFTGESGPAAATVGAQTTVKGPGRYRLRLANCDHEMLLWVNGSVVPFDGPTQYPSFDLISPISTSADPGDLAPAGIGSRAKARTREISALKA